MSQRRLRGIIAATPTPLHADFSPDLSRLISHCRFLLDNGCDGVNLLGTTGEANSFDTEQRLGIMQGLKEAGLPIKRFLVGTGVCALTETVKLTQAACQLGFAGTLVLPPFYYPGIEPEGLTRYVETVVDRVDHPGLAIYLYHIPQNTAVPWPLEVIAALKRRFPSALIGLKDSAGDLSYSRSVVQAIPDFDVFPSAEGSLSNAATDGYAGCISATTNITASLAQIGWMAKGSPSGAEAIGKAQAQRAALASLPLIASVKSALADRYNDPEWRRVCPPLQPLTAAQEIGLREKLMELD